MLFVSVPKKLLAWMGDFFFVHVCLCVRIPAGHPAGTRTAAVSGAVEPFDVAKYSRDAADGGEPREPHPGCSEPEK